MSFQNFLKCHLLPVLGSALLALFIVVGVSQWLLGILAVALVPLWYFTVSRISVSTADSRPGKNFGFSDLFHREMSSIGDNIEQILNEESAHINEHIHRIRSLIQDATLDLQASFSVIMAQSEQQSSLLYALAADQQQNQCEVSDSVMTAVNVDAAKVLAELTKTSEQIHAEVNNSIRALQFDDIVSQLSGHIQQRLEHINQVALVAHSDVASATQVSDLTKVAERLAAMRTSFHAQNLSAKVAQTDMDEGDVELF
ncbi:hypothetical protein [Halioxenophilus sp. WMMB6]|uniref:hypothetical protein n=1 Tax=Halioxenophilus sp. WMMB6 TaxID=3073815 RepID=UPI00295F4328|nr:hypothetical protein [Halioxenophilus sp. WMMB6]